MKKVMLVEDESELLRITARILEKLGLNVTRLDSSDKALASMNDVNPDIVITDWDVPQLGSGKEVLLLAKKQVGRKVVVLSGRASDEIWEQCEECRPNCVLQKPVDAQSLTTTLYNLGIIKHSTWPPLKI